MKEAPWSDSKTLAHPDKEERLSKEILQFEKYILPTKSEEADRLQMQEMFEDFVAATFPGMKAVPFGSHSTGLCLPGSDMDLDLRGDYGSSKTVINRMKKALLQQRICSYNDLNHVPFAKVPVLTINAERYPIPVDITANNPSPSSDRTIFWVKKHQSLRPLYLVLKHSLLALQHPRPNFRPMSSKFSGMASYTLVCLIVHFLEVEAEKQGCDPSSPSYYANLLVEFLSFYATFDFAKKGIQFFEKSPYFSKGSHPPMMILDPDVPGSNVGRSSAYVNELQECFAFLLDTIVERTDDGPRNSILQRIIPVSNQEPIDGTRRLESRNYEIEPIYMPHSESWEEVQTARREKARQRMDRRHGKKSAQDDDYNKRKRWGDHDDDDDDDVYLAQLESGKKNSNKRKRRNDDDHSSGYKSLSGKNSHRRW